MSVKKRILINVIFQSAAKLAALIIGLLSLGILTRYLGESGFGEYSTVIAFMGIAVAVADLGLYLILVKRISQGEDNREIISNVVGLRLTSAVIILLASSFLAFAFPYSDSVTGSMFIAAGAYLFGSLTQSLVGIFQKHLVQYWLVAAEVMGRVVNLVLIVLFTRLYLPMPYFITSLLVANATQFILTVYLGRRYEKFGIAFNWTVWKNVLRETWPLAFAVVLNLLYFKADTIILSLYYPAAIVGIYSLPYKILEVLLAFPAMFVGLVMPLMSRSAIIDWVKFRSIVQKTFDALIIIIIPIIITTLFFASKVIDIIKGTQTNFSDSTKLLQILIFAAGIIFLGTLFGYAVVAVDAQKKMVYGYLAGAVVGITSYFLLIPKFSYFGAAAGTVLTEVFVAIIAFYLVRKASGFSLSLITVARLLPGALLLSVFFALINLPWILEIILGLGLYSTVIILTRAVPRELVEEIIHKVS